ncbi:unnamed protein product [Meloidogyne enterolobii]|uniref:Uncharacterized protein n=1 Tax=Meloidogyne enterolobii TaxID=390850 RepID=A0ACB0YI40_MELEN
MSVRRDCSYSTLYNQLRRFNSTKAVEIEIPVESFPGDSVEFLFRVNNPLVIEHVCMEKGIFGQKELGNLKN